MKQNTRIDTRVYLINGEMLEDSWANKFYKQPERYKPGYYVVASEHGTDKYDQPYQNLWVRAKKRAT